MLVNVRAGVLQVQNAVGLAAVAVGFYLPWLWLLLTRLFAGARLFARCGQRHRF